MMYAAEKGDVSRLELLIREGADIEARGVVSNCLITFYWPDINYARRNVT